MRKSMSRRWKSVMFILIVSICFSLIFGMTLTFFNHQPSHLRSEKYENASVFVNWLNNKVDVLRRTTLKQFIENTTQASKLKSSKLNVSYNVHVFYYPWYGNPETDGSYFHWNHEYIPHWDKSKSSQDIHGSHKPPDDIGANFYPQIGPYSSRSVKTIDLHMSQIRSAGVGVVVVSWYPPGKTDQPGVREPDAIIPQILDSAAKFKLKVTLHVEPYKNRSIKSLKEDFKYIKKNYFNHEAFFKHRSKDRLLPLLYIYDSYLIPTQEWKMLLGKDHKFSIRNKDYDIAAIALLTDIKHKTQISDAGFNGFYTYFGSIHFTYGSTWQNWNSLAKFAYFKNLIFIPSVAPGYIDTMVRPWNNQNSRNRQNGEYYNREWYAAILSNPKYVSITSFNEWHEGTQIEPAVPKIRKGFIYKDYSPHNPNFYLNLTNYWVRKFMLSIQNETLK